MKFQIGDKVLILHSDEEGVIVDFINKKMAMVEVRGVRFPVYMDQIDFPYFKRFTQNKKQQPVVPQKKYIDDIKKEKKQQIDRVADGVWLNFLPVMDIDEFGDEYVEKLKIYLVNHSETVYVFNYKLTFFGESDFGLKNTIQPFENFYIHDVEFSDMSDSPAFEFDFSLQSPLKHKVDHFEATVKIKPRQLFNRIEELKQKNEASFSYLLFENYPDKIPETNKLSLEKLAGKGFKIYNAKEGRKHLEPARSVVDLHIEKITDNYQNMDSYEILTLQLQTFEKFYELAIAHTLPHLVIIHGVGSGKLRDEIHDALKLKTEVSYFINQYDPKYGYGATEIFFKH